MPMFGITLVRAFGRLGIKLQRGIVEFLESDFTGVEAGDGVLAHQGEELAANFLTWPGLFFESERFEHGELLRRGEFQEPLSVKALAMTVEPDQSCSKWVLLLGVMRDHEVDKLCDSGFFGTRRLIAGNDDLRKAFDHSVLGGREELRMIIGRLDLQGRVADVSAGESPFAEAREGRCGSGSSEDAQNFPAMNSLSGHGLFLLLPQSFALFSSC